MDITIPQPLQSEHDELHAELVKATNAGGKITEAAKAVAALLHPHFVKEEAYALPPLGLLPRLAAGNITPEMSQVLSMTERLKAELPQMLQEHQAIVADRYFKADFAWRPPGTRPRNTPRERPLVGAQTARLTRKTTPSAPQDVSHALVLATRGRRDAQRAHFGHDRPPRDAERGALW
jgi:hypothetical protein